ncbi:MAG: CotH kinase family protein, partial [Bacteroidota bacterium]
LQFESTTTLRAKSYRTGYLGSYPLNKTYFINAIEHDLPVVSVTTDSVLLYDEDDGIFVKIATDTGWVDKEIPAGIEYYEEDGTLAFSANAGVSLQGGNTRQHAQKSMEVQFRNKYGTKEIKYRIFKNNYRDRFDSFNLRSSGNDWSDNKNNLGTMYADGLQHSILENEMDLEIMSYQPAAVYINGEYYGLLNVRERQNEEYLDYYFDIDQDNLDMFRITRGKFYDTATIVVHNGDMQHFDNLAEYLQTADMSTPQAYDYVKTQVDIKSVINYYIAETYYASIDWPTNNHKLWRPKEEGGKWRWMLFDMDFGFNNFKWTTWPVWEAWWKDMFPSASGTDDPDKFLYSYIVFGSLQDNQEFVDEFVQTYSHHMNTTFDTTRLTHFVDSLKQNIANEMHYHIDRWSDHGGTSSYDAWESNIQKYFDFADLRTPWMWQIMKDYFELNDTTRLTVNNQPDKGSVYLYDVGIKSADFTGIYYKDNIIELSAVPKPGYSVKGWKIYQSDNTFTLKNQNPLEYAPGDYNRIEVEYEPYREIVINEVSALNETIAADENEEYDDWIELYNPNDFDVNVGGYYLTDDLDNVDKWRIPSTNPEITTIPAKGFLVFWADDQQEQGILHTNFKLTSAGEGVGLAREFGPAVHFIDTLTFPAMEADVSYGRTADGATTFTIFATPTPDAANDPNASGIADAYLQDFEVNVFPNPVQNELTIELERQSFNVSPVTINLYDISGRLVQQVDVRDLDFSDRITVSTVNFEEGMYLLNVKQNDRSKTVKVIKQGN